LAVSFFLSCAYFSCERLDMLEVEVNRLQRKLIASAMGLRRKVFEPLFL